MKTVKTKKVVHNSVTGSDYPIYKRVSEEGDPPIKGLWSTIKDPVVLSKKKCVVCGSAMREAGTLPMTNPKTKRTKIVQVLVCTRCSHRTLE